MRDPGDLPPRPATRPQPRPRGAPLSPAGAAGGPVQRGRGRRQATSPGDPRAGQAPKGRKGGNRVKVAFAVLALSIIISLVLGTLVADLGAVLGLGGGQSAPVPPRGQANLVPTYEAHLRDNPDDAQTMVILANILQNRGDYPGAIAWYERAVAIKPGDLETRLAFGQALASGGQRVDAEIQYRKALDLDPQNPRTAFYLGQIYDRWDPPRLEEARLHYGRASELQPEGAWGQTARQALDRLNATPAR